VTTYADSSALLAVYVTEAFSAEARRQVAAVAQIPFTALHDLEVRNAFLALRGRYLITQGALRALTAQLDADLQANRLLWVSLDLAAVFAAARHLAEAHTAKLLCRSLDVLHIAAASAIGCSRLISGDDRQLKLARTLRFTTVDIKRASGRKRRA